jgi:muconolactone delta-isomerase
LKKANRQNRKFAEKVLKYLWDDAFKFNKDEIFDITKVNSLEKVITEFVMAKGIARFEKIFKQNIVDALVSKK